MATGVAVLNRDGGKWEGGYVSIGGARDTKTYVIERRFKGRRFHVSTGCHDRRSALAHLDRFERNPYGYKPEGERVEGGLHVTEDDVMRYITWTRKVKGNTREHAREVKRYLAHWLADLGDVDWKGLKLVRLKEILAQRKTSRAYRIAALKAFGFGSLDITRGDLCVRDRVIQLGFPPARIDLLTSIDGVTWEEARSGSVPGTYASVPVRFLSRADLVRNKRASGRPQDIADAARLEGQ